MPNRKSAMLLIWVSIAGLAASLPAAGAIGPSCPEGSSLWVFHNGLTPYTTTGGPGMSALSALAKDWAEAQCAAAWPLADPYVTQVNPYWTFTKLYSTGGPDPCNPVHRWSFSCRVCIEGHPPAWPQKVSFDAPIGMGEAGDSATALVPGRLISGGLRMGGSLGSNGATASGTPTYSFQILTDEGMVDVEVDAITGRATLGTFDGVCQNR